MDLLGSYGDFDLADLNYGDDYYTEDASQQGDNLTSADIELYNRDFQDDLIIMQNSNSENDISNVGEMIDIDGIIESVQYQINQTSENTYVLTLSDNTTMTVGVLQVYDLNSFKEATKSISNQKTDFDAIILDFKDNLYLKFDPWTEDIIKLNNVKNLIIRGYGATIYSKGDKNDEYHFLNVNSDATVWMHNITVSGFNTAVRNHGTCQFTNVTFSHNKVDYYIEEDYGGAVRNWGILKCFECSFLDNSAKYGGAVYNEKGSQSIFIDCCFNENNAYDCGSRSLETDDMQNIYTLSGASCLVLNHNDEIKYVNIYSQTDYENFLNQMDNVNHVKFLVLNFTSPIVCNVNRMISMPYVENLYILGNGATINVNDRDDSNEYNFLELRKGQFCLIENLNIVGFNIAIINKGSLAISQSTFNNNRADYIVKQDYGGAIYNDEGLITISETTFKNGYAKYGGAIYNEKGIISCKDSIFASNKAYSDGGAIYNNVGVVYCEGCNFTSNAADDGGAIFNHYGVLTLYGNIFNKSTADGDGGAIYNDFGRVVIGNCTFIDSKAENGRELYNYGEEAEYVIMNDTLVIRNGVISKMDITSDEPSEALRIVLRIGEIVACYILVAVAGYFLSPGVATFVGFIGGALLAGVEELIEGVYLDHNFNFFNCLIMMGIAGAFDAGCSWLSSYIGRTCFKVGTAAISTAAKTGYAIVSAGIEFTGEVLTEFIPRIDVSSNIIPTTIIDLENPKIPS